MLTNIITLAISRRDPLETSQDLVRTFTNNVPDTKHHKQCILLCAIRYHFIHANYLGQKDYKNLQLPLFIHIATTII